MYRYLTFLLLIISCTRINYVVLHKGIYGNQNNTVYAYVIEGPRKQYYDYFLGWQTSREHSDSRRLILKINVITEEKEELWLSQVLEEYEFKNFSISSNEKLIAFISKDTLYIFDMNKDSLISEIPKGKSPSFFPDNENVLLEINKNIYKYFLKNKSLSLLITDGIQPKLSGSGNKVVFKRGTQIILYNLLSNIERVIADTGTNPNINPSGDKIVFVRVKKESTDSDYIYKYVYKAIITDTLGNILKEFPIYGAYSGIVYMTPYPYFVNNNDFVYFGYKEYTHPLKSIYFQPFNSNYPVVLREDYKTYLY